MNADGTPTRQHCPLCGKPLTNTEYNFTKTKLKKENARLSSKLAIAERRNFEQVLRKAKLNYEVRIESMKRSQATQKRIFNKKLKEEKLKHRKKLTRVTARMKKDYQIKAQNIRDIYANHYLPNENRPAGFDSSESAAILSQYEAISQKITSRLDAINDNLATRPNVTPSSTSAADFNSSPPPLIDSELIANSDEVQKLAKLKEIAEIIKRIYAEKKKERLGVYDKTNVT